MFTTITSLGFGDKHNGDKVRYYTKSRKSKLLELTGEPLEAFKRATNQPVLDTEIGVILAGDTEDGKLVWLYIGKQKMPFFEGYATDRGVQALRPFSSQLKRERERIERENAESAEATTS